MVLLIPSVFTTRTAQVAYLKTTVFDLGVMAMAVLWLLDRLKTNRWDLVRLPLYRPILAMLGVGLLSTLISSYKYATISEMLTQIGYVAFFLIVLNTIREGNQFRRLVTVMLVGAIIPCIYGVIQLLHLDWMSWIPEPSWKRLISTLANATYFAAYLVTLLPLGIAVLTAPREDRSSARGSLAAGLLVLLMATCLIYTYARAAWFGFLFVLLVQAMLAAFWLKGREKLRMLIPAVALCLPLAAAFVLPGTWFLVERAKSSFTADPSNVQRALTWQGAFNIFKNHPIIGTGPGSLVIHLPDYQSPEFFRTQATVAAHAHNEFLEVASDTGVLGLLAFLWLLVTYYWFGFKGLKKIRDTRWRLIIAGLMAGVGAFLICNLAGVTMRRTSGASFYWLFLALTGCAIQIAVRDQGEGKKVTTTKEVLTAGSGKPVTVAEVHPRVLPSWARRSLYVLIPLLALFGTINSAKLLAAQFHMQAGNNLVGARKFAEATHEYEKAISLDPFGLGAYYRLGNIYASLGDLKQASEVYLRLRDLAPSFARLHYNLGRVYFALNNLEKAREELGLAAKMDNLPSSWLHLGMAEAKSGHLPEAKEHIYKALNEDRTLDGVDPHVELGWGYRKAGKLAEALDEYKKALEFSPEDHRLHTNLGTVYFDAGRFPDAIREYEEAIRLNPGDAVAYGNLAAIYNKQGKTKMAQEMWDKVKMYAPSDEDLARRLEETLAQEEGIQR